MLINNQISFPIENKKRIEQLAKDNAKQIVEAGEDDLFQKLSQCARMEQYAKVFTKEIRLAVQDELNGQKYEAYGMEFTEKNAPSRLNYSDDLVWNELKEALKQREELLKVASKSDKPIFDDEGVEVTRCSKVGGGTVLNVKW